MAVNRDAWQLWLTVQTQWRGAGLGIVGLDYTALYHEARRLQIPLCNCTMEKIKALERHTLKKMRN